MAAGAAWPAYRWRLEQRRSDFAAKCRAARQAKQWPELAQVSAEWCDWDPNDGSAWLFAAEAAQATQDWQREADCLGRVPDADPRVVLGLMERMRLLFEELNRPLEAVDTCERILKIEPRASRAHSRLLFFYATSLQRQELMRCIRRAIVLRCEPPEAYVYLFGADWVVLGNVLSVNTHWLKAYPDHEPFLVARAVVIPGWRRTGRSILSIPTCRKPAIRR